MAGVVLSDAARQLLESDAVAHVVTIDDDGRPHVTAAWVGLDRGDIVIATLPDQRKLKNLRRDPRIASHGGRCTGALAATRAHVPRPRRRVPQHARSAAGVRHEDHPRTPRRCRTVEPAAPVSCGRIEANTRSEFRERLVPAAPAASPSAYGSSPVRSRARRDV